MYTPKPSNTKKYTDNNISNLSFLRLNSIICRILTIQNIRNPYPINPGKGITDPPRIESTHINISRILLGIGIKYLLVST